MRVAVVGSRKRDRLEDKLAVESLIKGLDDTVEVVSGGCRGIDSWAIDAAIKRGLTTMVFNPGIQNGMKYEEMVKKYYARNRKVVDYSDMVIAFTHQNKYSGGTGYTIKYAEKCGKTVIIY